MSRGRPWQRGTATRFPGRFGDVRPNGIYIEICSTHVSEFAQGGVYQPSFNLTTDSTKCYLPQLAAFTNCPEHLFSQAFLPVCTSTRYPCHTFDIFCTCRYRMYKPQQIICCGVSVLVSKAQPILEWSTLASFKPKFLYLLVSVPGYI